MFVLFEALRCFVEQRKQKRHGSSAMHENNLKHEGEGTWEANTEHCDNADTNFKRNCKCCCFVEEQKREQHANRTKMQGENENHGGRWGCEHTKL